MKHISWDFGIADEETRKNLKSKISESTIIKTLCNSKVTKDNIDNECPSCKRCIRNFQGLEESASIVNAISSNRRKQGLQHL